LREVNLPEPRTTCLLDGCKRTTAGYIRGGWICGEHWRRYIPPRSRIRRAYHALYRKGKRLDWPDELVDRWWKLWTAIKRRARRLHDKGDLSEAEINRLMGWD
jgi:hypothetical protein